MAPATQTGRLADGAVYKLELPDAWNGTLLLYSMPIPVGPNVAPWPVEDRLIVELVRNGYAVAGCSNTIFWPLEPVFANSPALVERFEATAGVPERTIGFGLSIGGIITAGLVQHHPDLLDAALPMCGNLAGAVAIHNRELDIAFVIATLLAPQPGLELTGITDEQTNVHRAESVLAEARASSAGRARLALAAAVGNIPGWRDPTTPEPAADNHAARVENQIGWYEDPGFLVYFGVRRQVEKQAGGNPSWNTESDYRALLERSTESDLVEALYRAANLSLDDDLAVLEAAPRIEADPEAVVYLERHVVFDGRLNGLPVLTMHTDGDGLVTPDNEHAYADVVGWAGDADLLRQIYVRRGGHCSFTLAEILTALEALRQRLDDGRWPALEPETLNSAAAAHGDDRNLLRSGEAIPPGFFDYEPRPFPRPYDLRHSPRRPPSSTL